MNTITKQWLQQKIADMESTRDEIPFGLDEDGSNTLAAMKLALASLEAEAVGYMNRFTGRVFTLEEQPGADTDVQVYMPVYSAPPAPVAVPDNIDARMKNAGMLSATEIIAGQPIDAFMKHAGVVDLASLLKWAEMRRAEFLRMQAKYVLGDNPKDDMYEWVISHVAAFSELHVNIRAAMLQGADGKSQVIQDGWVACSERMPEDDSGVWVWSDTGYGYAVEAYFDGEWYRTLTDEREYSITHWMPLPAAPQQEVK